MNSLIRSIVELKSSERGKVTTFYIKEIKQMRETLNN